MDLINNIELWILTALSIAVLFGSAELGFRYGRRMAPEVGPDVQPHVATIEGALLGLLALLLGFAFAMAMNRYDNRKALVIEEADAIQTTYLRAQLLPKGFAAEVGQLLKDYLASRIAYYEVGASPDEVKQVLASTKSLQIKLWAKAVAAVQVDADEVRTGYFIESLNGLIDDHTKRLAAMDNHVPDVILGLLGLVACLTIGVTGYSSGLKNARLGGVRMILVVLVAATLLVIVDLDRPRRGLITVSERSLREVQQVLQSF